MATDRLTIHHTSVSDVVIKLGDQEISTALRSADIYLRAGQTPEVVLRPTVTEWATVLDGPKVSIAADVALILEHAGWAGPDVVAAMVDKDSVVMLEQERDGLQARLATMEEDLANSQGLLADLELANRVLHDELEAAQQPAEPPPCLACDIGAHSSQVHIA